jgi:hypothetical protein
MPVNNLKRVCEDMKAGQFTSGGIPKTAMSSDMKVLLDAFANMMVACNYAPLKIGSDLMGRGFRMKAYTAFEEGFDLYSLTSKYIYT